MITILDLSFRYTKKAPLFEHLDLSLTPGHIYGLLGKNGAGKTTLLKLICGLTIPLGGTIIARHHIPSERLPEFLQDLYFLPEEIFLPAMDPSKLVRGYATFYPNFDETRFRKMLEQFEISWAQKFASLSYGQKKKAMIAFALACNTRTLLMDEPTNGLDIPSKATFRSLLAGALQEERILLISTHQVRDLQSLIDHVLVLDQGQIVLSRSMDEIAVKYVFGHSSGSQVPPSAVYSENGEMGQLYVSPNTTGEPGRVDLETLFNAAVASANQSTQLFS